MKPLLRTDEVAARLGLSVWTVRAWRNKGVGPPATKIGAAVRYDQDRLEAWLAQRTEQRDESL